MSTGNALRVTSTAHLRAGLLEDLGALRDGTISRSEARTRAYVAKQVIDTMKVDLVAMSMRLGGNVDSVALLPAQ